MNVNDKIIWVQSGHYMSTNVNDVAITAIDAFARTMHG